MKRNRIGRIAAVLSAVCLSCLLLATMVDARSMPEDNGQQTEKLLYIGHASIRITTAEGKTIYIDPYVGEEYESEADLILITHGHYDHNNAYLVANRQPDCRIITWEDAIINGEHQTFNLGYVTVEAVEAGYNDFHDVNECVGYVLTFSDGITVYLSGDTSMTNQMPLLAVKEIDYAFYCCDGVYNMGPDEAAECAALVGARHNIPYHVISQDGVYFDREQAEQFSAPNRMVLEPGEEIELTTDRRHERRTEHATIQSRQYMRIITESDRIIC